MSDLDIYVLRTVPLFNLLDDTELTELTKLFHQKTYLKGQLIFSEGDKGNEMFIVQFGRVELFLNDTTDEHVTLTHVEPGQYFGELVLLDNQQRSASARALENTRMLVIDHDGLFLLIKAHPRAALHIMQVLAKRVRDATTLIQERGVRNANIEIDAHISFGDRLSDFMINASSNLYFVTLSLVWFVVWIVWNMGIIPGLKPFDPFPFGLLTMIVSLEMVFLSLFILIKQSRQVANDKIRNDIEYEVNVRAEAGIRALSKQVEMQQEAILDHLASLNAFQAAQHIKQMTAITHEADRAQT